MNSLSPQAQRRITVMFRGPPKNKNIFPASANGWFLEYPTSFTFRRDTSDPLFNIHDNVENDVLTTKFVYVKLLHLPNGHVPNETDMHPFYTAIEIMQDMSPYDRHYYLLRGIYWNDETYCSRKFSFYYTQEDLALVEVSIVFMPKSIGSNDVRLCIYVDRPFANATLHAFLEYVSIHIDERRIHIGKDINAFS